MESPNAQFWKEAMHEEMNSLKENDIYEYVILPPGQKLIDSKCFDKSSVPREVDILLNIPFHEVIGSLMHLSCLTRPDLAYAVNKVSQKLAAPTKTDKLEQLNMESCSKMFIK